MESKIEKIEGAYDIPILKDKLNRVIDYLNSQDQEEICTHDFDLNNRCTKCGVRGVKDMIAELQDTPEEKEEWRGEDWKLDIRTCLLFDDKTQSLGMIMSHEQIQDLEDFISQLLSERTFSKEELELILYNINYNDGDEVIYLADDEEVGKLKSKIYNLLREKE